MALGDAADRLAHYAEDVLERRGNRRVLNQALEQAGIPTSAGEFIVIIACVALGGGLVLGLLAGSFAVTIMVAVGVAAAARAFVSIQAARRREQFNAQLGDTLQLLGAHLRTGYSLLQSFDIIAKEAEAPTSVEFQRLVTETRLGRDVGEALEAMHDRVGSEDFRWVTQAIEVHREVGGDLAEVLENVAVTIRDRDHVRRQVKALSADGRISAIVLIALPFVLMGGLAVLNPEYVAELFDRTGGRVALAFAGALIAFGAAWMRRIIRLKF
jgi:tight adherence protein B